MILTHRFIRLFLALLCAVCVMATRGATLVAPSEVVPDSVPKLLNDTLVRKRLTIVSDSLYQSTAKELGVLPIKTVGVELPVDAVDSVSSVVPMSSAALDSTRKALRREQRLQKLTSFTPDPNKATWAGIVFPGGGQIYNHKYWRLPILP